MNTKVSPTPEEWRMWRGHKKVAAIKSLRARSGLGLHEAYVTFCPEGTLYDRMKANAKTMREALEKILRTTHVIYTAEGVCVEDCPACLAKAAISNLKDEEGL